MVHYAVVMGVVMKEIIRGACARIAQFAIGDVRNGFIGALEVIMLQMVCGLESTVNNATSRYTADYIVTNTKNGESPAAIHRAPPFKCGE